MPGDPRRDAIPPLKWDVFFVSGIVAGPSKGDESHIRGRNVNPPESWFYVQQGAATGPVPRATMEAMIRAGSVRPDTLVWSGSGDWLPAGNSALAFLFGGGGAPAPVLQSSGMPAPQNKYESFVFAELAPRLGQGEQFHVTALLFTGSLLRLAAAGVALGAIGGAVTSGHALHFGVATDRRLFLIRTKMGVLALKTVNLGVSEILYDAIAQVTAGGTLNQRTISITMKDGTTVELRLNTVARTMSGQKQFIDRFQQLVQQRRAAMGQG